MALIFLIEDNDSLREAVSSYLQLDDHEVVEFSRLQGVLEAVRLRGPDCIVLDVMLPDGNGFQLARKIKSLGDIPIVFLTARSSESDRITGFELGADDYVVKPFSPRELTLRVKALLKRSGGAGDKAEPPGRWLLGDRLLSMDAGAHLVRLGEAEVTLTAAEWKILEYLARHAGQVIDRDRLLGAGLDYLAEGSERTIDTHVKNIRAKLGSPGWIETVRGFGYRFAGRPTDANEAGDHE
jgi:DNA-binding response OmpR family regulator